MKAFALKVSLGLFVLVSCFQFYRIALQGLAEYHFKPVIAEIPKAYSLDLKERQNSIASISNGELWLEVLNRIRFAILLDPQQARYHRWLGIAFTARAAAVPPDSELQRNLLLEADTSFQQSLRLNPVDPYILEHVLLSKARLGRFDKETELLFKNIRLLAPRESQIHLQVLLEYLPRYFGMSPEIKQGIDSLYEHLVSTGGSRKVFEIRQYAQRLGACKTPKVDELPTLLRWPVHICSDIELRQQILRKPK